MESFIAFLGQQWILVGALLACIFMLIYHDSRRAGQSLSPQGVVNLINREGALVVDLRDAKEFKAGHILDAKNIPFNKVDQQLSELEPYKEKPLILVDKLGQHTGSVGKRLAKQGFTQLHRMSGGMAEWQSQHLPVVK